MTNTIKDDELRYPIGRFTHTGSITPALRTQWLGQLRSLPEELGNAVQNLSDDQLDTPYRSGGWTVRQVVHHLPDSHLNSYIRFKLALTEDSPSIRTYHEGRWAELSDAKSGPVAPSLLLLSGLHARWTSLLAGLNEDDFARTFHHPELREVRLDSALGLYAWHSRHHLAQIGNLGQRMNW